MQPSDRVRACRSDTAVDATSPSPSLDPAALASLDAQKHAAASAAATASPAPSEKGAANGTCSKVGVDENLCVSHMSKDSSSVVEAQLLRTGGSALVVDVAASNGKGLTTADQGELPSDATMTAIAVAVAAHF